MKINVLHGKHIDEKIIDSMISLSENKDMNEVEISDYYYRPNKIE